MIRYFSALFRISWWDICWTPTILEDRNGHDGMISGARNRSGGGINTGASKAKKQLGIRISVLDLNHVS